MVPEYDSLRYFVMSQNSRIYTFHSFRCLSVYIVTHCFVTQWTVYRKVYNSSVYPMTAIV